MVASVARDGNGSTDLVVRLAGESRRYRRAQAPDGAVWYEREGRAVAVSERPNLLASHAESVESGPVTSPMPGTVLVVEVEPGDVVRAGEPLLVVEAMKMEHTITAPVDGVVSRVDVRVGQQVALDEPLALVTPEEGES